MTILKVTLSGADKINAKSLLEIGGFAQRISDLFGQEKSVAKIACSARLGTIDLSLHPGVMNSTIERVRQQIKGWGMNSRTVDE
ncbi:MAG: hypothetical protein V2A63_04305 [Patescibacteria group bacterium]